MGSSAAFAEPLAAGGAAHVRPVELPTGAEVETFSAGAGRRDVATQRTSFQLEEALLSAAAAPGGGAVQLNLANLAIKSPRLRLLEGARFSADGRTPSAVGSLDAPPPSWKFKHAAIGRGAPAPFSPGAKPQARDAFLGYAPSPLRAAAGAGTPPRGGGVGSGKKGTPLPPPPPAPRATPGTARRGPPPPVAPSASPRLAAAAAPPPPPPPPASPHAAAPPRRPDSGAGAARSLNWSAGRKAAAPRSPAGAPPGSPAPVRVGGALVAAYALEPLPPDLSALSPPPAPPREVVGLTPAGAARVAAHAAAAPQPPPPPPHAPPATPPPVAWAVHTKQWAPVDAALGVRAAGMSSEELAAANPVPPPLPSRSKLSPKGKGEAAPAAVAAGDAVPPPTAEPAA